VSDVQAAELPNVRFVPAGATSFRGQKQFIKAARERREALMQGGAQVKFVQKPHVALVACLELQGAQAATRGEK
jgi:hypothetical protein